MADLKIGLLGGSFNPAHQGHRDITLAALRRLGLDQVWWLVTPGNPLKRTGSYAAYDKRIAEAQHVANHPQIHVSDFEQRHQLRFTVDTLGALKMRFPRTSFVWLMGADSLAGFHRWKSWRDIGQAIPFAVFNRPGHLLPALSSPAAHAFAKRRLPEEAAKTLPYLSGGHWTMVTGTANPQSATALRAARPRWVSSD